MIEARIIIETNDGCQYSYVNKFLAEKTGDDGENHTKFAGFPEKSYYYTGYGDDKYENQTDLGMAKADFEYIKSQVDLGTGTIQWPEGDSTHTDTDILVRQHDWKGSLAYDRTSMYAEDVKMVKLEERDVVYPLPSLRDNEEFTNPTYNNDAGIPRTEKYVDNYIPQVKATVSGDVITLTNADKFDTIYYRVDKDLGWTSSTNTEFTITSKYIEFYGQKGKLKCGISVYYAE